VAHLPAEKKFEYEILAADEIDERINLAPGERIQIYRIAQEVINNICRHSDARHVALALQSSDSKVTLTIEDDGKFFAPENNNNHGRGLANIHARASLLEAEVSWTERPIGGNTFKLEKAV
jgi:signal transduction histidine kinase